MYRDARLHSTSFSKPGEVIHQSLIKNLHHFICNFKKLASKKLCVWQLLAIKRISKNREEEPCNVFDVTWTSAWASVSCLEQSVNWLEALIMSDLDTIIQFIYLNSTHQRTCVKERAVSLLPLFDLIFFPTCLNTLSVRVWVKSAQWI